MSITASEYGIINRAGSCAVRRVTNDEGADHLVIDRADPRIDISAQLVAEFRSGKHHPHVAIVDDVITIRGDNRTVIYRLTGEQSPTGAWVAAEWPD